MSSPCVLDASAVLALLNDEPGAGVVQQALLSGAFISSVNLAEVVGKLIEVGLSPEEIRRVVGGLGLDIKEFDSVQGYETGFLRLQTTEMGLSLGDRACMALAVALHLPVLTADRSWLKVELPVEVQVLR
jgi:PIN domain nuclease of toxin-antitoxin system